MNRELDIDSIFCRAIEIPSDQDREEYLTEVCRGNSEFKKRIQKLLAAHVQAGNFMNDLEDCTIERPSATEKPVMQIGPYKLREQIGEGGMGIVSLRNKSGRSTQGGPQGHQAGNGFELR